MSDLIVIIVAVCLPIAWLISEFQGPRALRITLGLACLLVLVNAWIFSRQRNEIHNAHNAAFVRMLGEALERNDIETAQKAIEIYSIEKDWHPAFVATEYLDEQAPEQTTAPE
jgi:hypothetical protein